jgi:hypothetical protein
MTENTKNLLDNITQSVRNNNASIGETGHRLVQLGNGSGTGAIIDSGNPVSGSVYWYVGSDDGTGTIRDQGTAILSSGLAHLYANDPALDGTYISIGKPPKQINYYVLREDAQSAGQQFGQMPLAAQAQNAAGQPAISQVSTLRIQQPDPNNPSFIVTVGSPGEIYSYPAAVTLAHTEFNQGTFDLTATQALLTPGQHQVVMVCLNYATNTLALLTLAAVTAISPLPSRDEFSTVDFASFDLLNNPAYEPIQIVYLYYGQGFPAASDYIGPEVRTAFPPVSAYLAIKNNWSATIAPVVGNDNTQGYSVGSRWYDTTHQIEYVALSVATGAAVWKTTTSASGGSGDVVGPSSAVDSDFALFDGTTGKLIKDGGLSLSTDGTFAGNSDSLVPSQKAAKLYVDNAIQGLSPKPTVYVWSASALPTVTYANGVSGVGATLTAVATGVLTVDGITIPAGVYLGIKDQVAQLQNGFYYVTTAGAVGVAFVLTRATFADVSAELIGAFSFTKQGTSNHDTGWICSNTTTISVGSTAITFELFATAGINQITGDVSVGPGSGSQAAIVNAVGGKSSTFVASATGKVLDNESANLFFAGPASGAAAAPGFRAPVAADIAGALGGVTVDALPDTDVTRSLGSYVKRWLKGFFKSVSADYTEFPVLNDPSGGTVAVGACGYLAYDATNGKIFKTTTTANFVEEWCVVTGLGTAGTGAVNTTIYVSTQGTNVVVTLNANCSAGNLLTLSTTAGQAAVNTKPHFAMFAICLTANAGGAGGTCTVRLICGTKPVAATSTVDVYRHDSISTQAFVSTISGTPSTTSVTYGTVTSGAANVLVPQAAGQLGLARLYNTTRGTFRLITAVNTGTKVITTVASTDTWANTDTITIESPTVTTGSAFKATEIDLNTTNNTVIPYLTRSVFVQISASDTGAVGQFFAVLEYSAYSVSHLLSPTTQVATILNGAIPPLNLIGQVFCITGQSSGAGTGTAVYRLAAYNEAIG